jgi:hypothetical protein
MTVCDILRIADDSEPMEWMLPPAGLMTNSGGPHEQTGLGRALHWAGAFASKAAIDYHAS